MSSLPENDKHTGELQQSLELLETIPFFSGFPIQAAKLISFLCEKGVYAEGDMLVQKGEDNGLAFYILSGELAVLAEGKEESVLHFGPGDFMGGLSLLGSLPSLFSLKAVKKTEVLLLSRDQFQGVLEQYPDLNRKIPSLVLQLLRNWESRQLEAAANDTQSLGVTLL